MSIVKIKAGSRGSRLALSQVKEIETLLKQRNIALEFERIIFKTAGDQDKKIPLTENPADDFFTDTLDQAILNRTIDIAVHSAKDIPKRLQDGLEIFALTERVDETDAFVGKTRLKDLNPGSRVGTSSLLRREMLRKFYPDLVPVSIRGSIDERLRLMEMGECEGIIVATIALKRLKLEHLIKDILPWEGTPLQSQLAVVGRKDERALKELFSAIDIRERYGRVFLVGAGPGDPELITLKGIKILESADCVFYDYLTSADLLKYAPKAEKIYVGKRKGAHTLAQSELCRMLRQKAVEGKTVVRLKGGDPLVFGRGAEEIEYLRSFHIAVEVIPGVSSATGIPSSLGIPLTARDVSSSVAFVSGHRFEEEDKSPQPIKIPDADTIIFLMGLTKLKEIVQALINAHWSEETPLVIISKGTCPDEVIIEGTLKDILLKANPEILKPPALIIVGETIKFSSSTPCRQKYFLYTGTQPAVYQRKFKIIPWPMIEITSADVTDEKRQYLIDHIPQYDMVIFTSVSAVRYFTKVLEICRISWGELKSKKIITIGKYTAAALRELGLEVNVQAQNETSSGLLTALKDTYSLQGQRILFPRSSLPNHYLKDHLQRLGSIVDEITVYQNLKPHKRELPDHGLIEGIIFTSPSTVNNFLEDYGHIPSPWRIYAKGIVTMNTLEQAGYKSEVLSR